MPKPIKRSDLSRPLTCAEHDENIDRLLDRSNHTGTQSCSTIFDLELCVRNFQYIKDLLKCCDDLKKEIEDIKYEIYDDSGELYKAISQLRTELLNLINSLTGGLGDLQSILISVDARLDALEACCTAVQSAIGALDARITALENKVDEAIPIGGIILWSGSITSIPTRYRLADGTGGTPDLRDRFVIGAGGTRTVGQTGGSFNSTVSGSNITTSFEVVGNGTLATNPTALTVAQLPPHTHGPTNSGYQVLYFGGSGEFPFVTSASGAGISGYLGSGAFAGVVNNGMTGGGLPHSHTITGQLASHAHTISLSGQTVNVTNPFYSLAYIMRVS